MTETQTPAPWLDRSRYPYEPRRIELDGHVVSYVDEGEGPPLLMLHGNPTWSFLYRDVIAGLRDRHRCVAIDLPGFGFSVAAPGYGFTAAEHARVVERLVEALDLRELTIMLHDWGGPIGLWVAGRHRERVRALVIANTWAWPVNGDGHFSPFSWFWGGPLGRLAIRHANAFVNLLIPIGTRRARPAGEVLAAYRGPFPTKDSRAPIAILAREILASRAFLSEVEAGLAALRDRPVLILWGDADPAFRARERQRFEDLFPAARTVVLEGAGHFVQEDAATDIVEAVRTWASGGVPA